ncbi:sensor domain-containing diguanylate cyclase [Enterovibrio sp. ZSDZ42]|uniref:diguanylate cyclase n=1 Tax=Enterovibrio gelatinilyticus TaxID=2899819 RepID=A0ABT5R1Q8_9GAMM|nr:sensor domain-containing diguanylate cyclase [Enterovibrio sp. ZSDZ42]MDD1794212.1 sensor domain-containing diguanylate cyclase [Enterovibrio sp. ZSDZ42]
MLKTFTINQLLFVSHLMLVLVLILGMSYSRYQSEWETRVQFATETAEHSLSPLLREMSGAIAARSYSTLMMPSQRERLLSIEPLLFLDIQGVSDYSDSTLSIHYLREEQQLWRTDVTEDEIRIAQDKLQTLINALDDPKNKEKVRAKKLRFLVNKAQDDLNVLHQSRYLTSHSAIPWSPPSASSQKNAYLSNKEKVIYLRLPLINKNGGMVEAVFDASALFSLKGQIYATIIAEASAALFISLLLIAGVTHWLVSPLRRLASRIDQDIELLDISDLDELHRNDEIGTLARGLHTLTFTAKSQMKVLRHQSDTDALTGIGGRHSYAGRAEPFYEAVLGQNQHFGIIVCDIDHFKIYNDTYGHARGDIVIKSIADTILSALRTNDHCFRIGGEEFVALLQLENPDALAAIAERMRAGVEELSIPHATKYGIVTISVGALLIAPSNNSWSYSDAFDEGDALLYKAKNNGRNQVAIGSIHSSQLPETNVDCV